MTTTEGEHTVNIYARRILHAFLRGFLAAMLGLALENWADLTNAVEVSDWVSMKNVGLSVLFGALAAGLRALQTLGPIPSPEPEENSSNRGSTRSG